MLVMWICVCVCVCVHVCMCVCVCVCMCVCASLHANEDSFSLSFAVGFSSLSSVAILGEESTLSKLNQPSPSFFVVPLWTLPAMHLNQAWKLVCVCVCVCGYLTLSFYNIINNKSHLLKPICSQTVFMALSGMGRYFAELEIGTALAL